MNELPERERLDSLRAAATLARSPRVKTIVSVALTLVILPAAGWVSAKLETKFQVDTLTARIDALDHQVTTLTSQNAQLARDVAAFTLPATDSQPGGPITQLYLEARHAQRNTVRAYAAALAFERNKEAKKKEAEKMASAFDNVINYDHEPPRKAAAEVIHDVSLP